MLYILYAEYSSSTYCWNAALFLQWVTSLSFFWPVNSEVGGGGAVNWTRSGGKSQMSLDRRVMPRGLNATGSAAPVGSVSVPWIAPPERLRISEESGAWMTMWIGSDAANSGFGSSAAAVVDKANRSEERRVGK